MRALLLILLAGCGSTAPAAPVARNVFAENEAEWARGAQIEKELLAGALSENYVGRAAIFEGNGNAINADLKTRAGVRVVVEVDPPIDVRPSAILWTAAVLGQVEAIDLPKRTVRVSAAPVNWKLTGTW